MPSRSERRRKGRRSRADDPQGPVPSLLRRSDVLTAFLLGTGALVVIIAAALLLSGDGDGENAPTSSDTPVPVFSPTTPDEIAIAELSRRTIEALPQGKWPELYDVFTEDFQQRCPLNEFVAIGQQDAEAQGANLSKIRYKHLRKMTLQDGAANAVIVGEVLDQTEYTIQAYFLQVGGEWKIAPAPDTQGCNAFSRLSG